MSVRFRSLSFLIYVIIGIVVAWNRGYIFFAWIKATASILLAGAAAVLAATLGDLAESMIKRDLEIKDMGTLLPGHGGILDRLDSLLIVAPVIWLLLFLFIPAG